MKRRLWIALGVSALLGIGAYLFWPRWYCGSAYDKYGFKVPTCPDGRPRLVVSMTGRNLKRGGDGQVELQARAVYTTASADGALRVELSDFDTALSLVSAAGEETPIEPQEGWAREGDSAVASIKLPQVSDGDYLLRARVKSKVDEGTVDLKLGLYAPARIHVLTDRPLYEPGNVIQFRALALRARDLSPIDNRPGVWVIQDPTGETLLEEKAPAAEWGVVAGDFPLAEDAEEGDWSVTWRSGSDEGSATFRVEPFTVPRFRVETSTDQTYYQAGHSPIVSGAVIYSSGAPVAGASLEISWSSAGQWPPPTEWIHGSALPRSTKTDAAGRFELRLPAIPEDLRGRCTLIANISAIDPAGDRVASSASIALSEDAIQVAAVTEMQGGLVENTNNRVYLRVTGADGAALAGAKINVKRAWAPGDMGIDAELDADGVARLQFDPGRPVSVIVPPMPVRRRPDTGTGGVSLISIEDLVTLQRATLADQVAVESWLAGLAGCTRFVRDQAQSVALSLRANPSGAITAAATGEQPLNQCLDTALRSRRLPPGKDRLYTMTFQVQPSNLPVLNASVDSRLGSPPGIQAMVNSAVDDARVCLPTTFEGRLPWVLFWRAQAKSDRLEVSWMKDTGATERMPAGVDGCILSRFAGVRFPEPHKTTSLGLIRFDLVQPSSGGGGLVAQPTIIQGYELTVTATYGGQTIGSTKHFMPPGAVPYLRLRANPVIASPGDKVQLAFFRGPEYSGELPTEIQWSHEGDYETIELKDKAKETVFELPAEAKGWYDFSAGGAHALVFVRSGDDLSVALTPASEVYAPGAMATINVQTNIAGTGGKAAVGLFGVDESLSQIATLRGPDDLGSIRPEITMSESAFGALDAQALTLGRIRGQNAAEATVLRVESIPSPAEIDVVLNESAATIFDPVAELTDRFYIALAELHVQTRAWEQSAAEGVTMTPRAMADLWKKALAACDARGEPALDAYDRPLRLHWLPSDLLALTDPAQVVADTTRLPEDVENWQEWVRKEKP